jgi:hypothetical protein
MSNSNINRIEPIVPYSKLLGNYHRPSSTTSKILRNEEKYKGAIEERLEEMDEKENVERIQKNKEQETLSKEKLKEKYGNELFAREINEVGKLKTNELSLGEECKKKLKMCGICGGHLDPSNFGNENSVVIVGDGENTYPDLEQHKYEPLGLCIDQHGVGTRAKKLDITFGQLYNEYMKKCNTRVRVCDIGCLEDITTDDYLKEMSKRFSYTDIVCGHKFHKKCILGEIEKKQKGIYEHGTVTAARGEKPVTCPTCGKLIRKLYYFLPTYCDKIDETGQFIVRKKQPSATAIPIATAIHTDIPTAIPTTAISTAIPKVIPTMKPTTPPSRSAMAMLGKNDTKKNKTKKLTFADYNDMRFYEKESETNRFFGGGRKRKSVRKTRRKNRKNKKTRKYKKN